MNTTATLIGRGILLLLLALFPGIGQAQYCTPVSTTSCTVSPDYIQSFSTSGGTSNISNLNSGCNGNANNYIYYSAQSLTIAPGNTFSWSATNNPSFPEYYAIWVDYNHNGVFTDPGEQVYQSNAQVPGGGTISGTVTVPLTAPIGATRIRVRNGFTSSQITPCGSQPYGETEDYNVNIVSGAGCTTPPTPGTISAFPSVICLSSPVTLMLSGYTAGTLIQWQQASGSVWTNIPGATSSALQLAAPTQPGFYRTVVTCPGTTLSSTSTAYQVIISNSAACQDSVWPGDANYDHIVNNLDPLAIALAYNYVGTPRAGASIAYVAQYATNWPTNALNSVNHKHADCNGDSIVNSADLAAVTANYGLTHPRGFSASNAKVAGLPDLKADLTGINVIPGTMVTVPIRFGDAGNEVQKIYGIAGTLQLQGINPAVAPTMSLNPAWMASAANLLSFSKATNNNFIDWAVSRTDHLNTSGNGILGTVSFMVPANASGQVTFHLQDVTLLDSAGNVLGGYNVLDNSAFIQSTGIAVVGTGTVAAAIVPNPSEGAARLQLQLAQPAGLDVSVVDMTGRKVWQQALHAASGPAALLLPGAELAPGIYSVRIRQDGDGAVQVLQWVKR